MAKNLVIVESPAKAKTIEGFLGKDYIVKSSFGHVRDLAKNGLSIDIDKGFAPHYEVSEDKKKVITELKKLSKDAEIIWLATDEDREGEAISWHLKEALELPDSRTKRITFNEITKPAIQNAIKNPRKIDKHLVDAQQARRVLDRLVGFELSPVLWKKVKPSLSAGRVQSVAVRIIVDREREINDFKAETFYRFVGVFLVDGKHLVKAELNKRFTKKKDALDFLEKCTNAKFKVADLVTKPAKRSPAAPFTTSTLQQEASRKIGMSVARTMSVAQKLYEAGFITYMRTDSVNLSDTAIDGAKNAITKLYGAKYSNPRKFQTKSKGAQEAHEAIRPTYLDKQTVPGDASEQKLYELIWKRTVASQMADALLEKTTVTIGISTTTEQFIAQGEVIKFDGFLKVYLESTDDENTEEENESMLPPMKVGQALDVSEITGTQRFTHHPARYTEASLVKKLEELGIGRPSTYAPTISTIQKRGYVVREEREGVKRNYDVFTLKKGKISEEIKTENTGAEKGKLFPTDIGIVVNDFLVKNFGDVLDFSFTASVEKEFDDIAQGMLKWNEMIRRFYGPFHKDVEETLETSDRATGERELGKDPETGKKVVVKIGRYGPMVMIGDADDEEKPRFASLRKEQSIGTITLAEAMDLFKLPRTLGESNGKKVVASVGRFGPYVGHDGVFASLKKADGDDPMTITLERALQLLEEKRKSNAERTIKTFPENKEVQVLKGRWGAFIKVGRKNVRIPKDIEPTDLTLEKCLELAGETKVKKLKAGESTGTGVKKAAAKKATPKKSTAKKTVSKKSASAKTAVKKTTTVKKKSTSVKSAKKRK
ncbi:MAG: type I DNA topoisomerase [Flavobacteriales bacterium]|nr:type I DNA topoisomerase [Flavobacteriales bacterium]